MKELFLYQYLQKVLINGVKSGRSGNGLVRANT